MPFSLFSNSDKASRNAMRGSMIRHIRAMEKSILDIFINIVLIEKENEP